MWKYNEYLSLYPGLHSSMFQYLDKTMMMNCKIQLGGTCMIFSLIELDNPIQGQQIGKTIAIDFSSGRTSNLERDRALCFQLRSEGEDKITPQKDFQPFVTPKSQFQ